MTPSEELPDVLDVETWPIKVELPMISILPVKHFTGQTQIDEGGLLVAVDGTVLPAVFVGCDEEGLEEAGASGRLTPPFQFDELLRALLGWDTGRMSYESVEEMILDGWRPS